MYLVLGWLFALAAPAPVDRDKDRIPDDQDRCPDEPETYNGVLDDDGCPDKGRVVTFRHFYDIDDKILFAKDSATLLPEFEVSLGRVVERMRGNGEIVVKIEGHRDPREKAALAAERARAVGEVLIARGVAARQVILRPVDEGAPVCTGRDEDCRMRNRCVEFRIVRSAFHADPKGWVDILPDARLTGWARVAPISTAGVESRVEPNLKVWVPGTLDGTLECRGDLPKAPDGGKGGSHEMLRYEKELSDFIFHVEWRFLDFEPTGWNAGVYARVNADATVWHQAQVGGGSGGYWFGDTPDATGKIVRRKLDPTEQRVRAAGEWNVYEITARGDRLTLWVNGAVTSEMTGLKIRRGHIGLEAERHRIEFRKLMLKELPP